MFAEASLVVSELGIHPVCSLSKMTLLRTFPGTDRSIIPLQFLHSCISPFYVSFTMYPSFHSVGISSCSCILPNRSSSIYVEVSMSALIASAGILSVIIMSSFTRGKMELINSASCENTGLGARGNFFRSS